MMADSRIRQPLFILAAPRSFTSLICAMVGQHPENYGVPELNLLTADTLLQLCEKMTGIRQIQLHGLLRTVAQVYAGEQTLASIDMARRWILRRLDYRTADIYWELCERVAPLCVIDKSPIYSATPKNLARLRRAFPDAYYLHLIRHPRTQGESVMNVADGAMAVLANSIDYSTDPPTVDPQIAWLRIQRNILDFLAGIDESRKLCLRGENVLNAPRQYLRKICRWLHISGDDRAIDVMLHPEDSPFACLGPLGAHLGNDINFLKSPTLQHRRIKSSPLTGPLPWRKDGGELQPEVIDLARQLGYE